MPISGIREMTQQKEKDRLHGGLSEIQSDIFDRSSDRCSLPLPASRKQTQRTQAGGKERQGSGKWGGAESTGVGERPIDSVSGAANLVRVHNRKSILTNTAGSRKGARQQ